MRCVCSLSKERITERPAGVLPIGLRVAGGALVLFAALLLARPAQGAHDATPEREAWYLVKQRCYLCHFIDQQDVRWGAKWGPSLKDLFKRATLINGKPVNDQTVSDWI